MNRGDIGGIFGISVSQSSTDIKRYFSLASHNLAYDKSVRTYVRSRTFSPLFFIPSASGHLSQIRSLAVCVLGMTDPWLGFLPDFDATPAPVQELDRDMAPSACAPKDQQIVLIAQKGQNGSHAILNEGSARQ